VKPTETATEVIVPPRSDRLVGSETLESELRRLQKYCIVELEQVQRLHEWLDGKRLARSACRLVGESRTGKTVACYAYHLKYPPILVWGRPPVVPVVYWHSPEDCGAREFLGGILDMLKYQLSRGTISEMRSRVYQVLKACQVEMLMIDEAHRLRSKTFSEVRDIFDKLGIAVVLVGTDRLEAATRRDEQVYNCFVACHRLQRLNAAQLVEVTAIWEMHVLKLPESSKLTSVKIQRLLGEATRGYIGLLDTILREAAMQALQRGKSRIDFATLQAAVQECQ